MKTKTLLFPIVALLAVFLVGAVSADNANSVVNGDAIVQLNGISINHANHSWTLAPFAGEVIPVKVLFTANKSAENVKVRVEVSNGNQEFSDSYFIGDTYNDGRLYTTGIMNLRIPSRLDDLDERVRIDVTISADKIDTYTETYYIAAQRESYKLEILSVDYGLDAAAGSTIPIMVVVKNRGSHDSGDTYLTVSVPELGISAKAYLDEIASIENCSNGCNRRDSVSKILNLNIPSNAKEGIYEVVVTAWNYDTKIVEKGILKVGKSSSSTPSTVATNKEQDLKAGETKSYDLVIVNSDNSVKVYTLSVVSNSNLDVTVPSTVIVNPQSASTVKVDVKVKNGAEAGRHTFGVLVNGEQTTFVANVNKKGTGTSSAGVIALTVLLAIIFVALLVLLIVLLFQREKKVEEVETSYY